jgi:hypothetical protein
LKYEKGKRDIKESTYVLKIEFDIMEKSECHICQIETFDFYRAKMVNISKWMSILYISQVGPCKHVFSGYAHISRIIWLDLTKKQRSASNYKKISSNGRFEASTMKFS